MGEELMRRKEGGGRREEGGEERERDRGREWMNSNPRFCPGFQDINARIYIYIFNVK